MCVPSESELLLPRYTLLSSRTETLSPLTLGLTITLTRHAGLLPTAALINPITIKSNLTLLMALSNQVVSFRDAYKHLSHSQGGESSLIALFSLCDAMKCRRVPGCFLGQVER